MLDLSTSPAVQETDVVVLFMDDGQDQGKTIFTGGCELLGLLDPTRAQPRGGFDRTVQAFVCMPSAIDQVIGERVTDGDFFP